MKMMKKMKKAAASLVQRITNAPTSGKGGPQKTLKQK